mgnify:FL=1
MRTMTIMMAMGRMPVAMLMTCGHSRSDDDNANFKLQLHGLVQAVYIFLPYFPYVISSSDELMPGSIDNQSNRQIDDDCRTKAKDRCENEYYPQQICIHTAPVCET